MRMVWRCPQIPGQMVCCQSFIFFGKGCRFFFKESGEGFGIEHPNIGFAGGFDIPAREQNCRFDGKETAGAFFEYVFQPSGLGLGLHNWISIE